MRRFITTLGLLFPVLVASAQTLPTQSFMLPNGLKVVLREDHRSPVASFQIWYKVGSLYEHNGITGLSHLLEHMMFKGTPTYPQGVFAETITQLGGKLNAFTSYDFTGYYETLPSHALETAFKLEADRMRNIDFSADAFEKELQVVIEERRLRTDDIPQALGLERFLASTFTSSPYRNPIIGWPSDLAQATAEKALDWYNQWYHPNNATLVIVGDIDPALMKKWAEQYFASIPEQTITPVAFTAEVADKGSKHIDLNLGSAVPMVYLSWIVPSYTDTDPARVKDSVALSVLASILDGGLSARFESRLVREQQKASMISTDYSAFSKRENLLSIASIATPQTSLLALKQAIIDEITALAKAPVDAETLARAKRQFKAQDIFARDSLEYQANEIGQLESIGLRWEDKETFLAAIDKITPEDIQAVAAKYLQAKQVSSAFLHPDKKLVKESVL